MRLATICARRWKLVFVSVHRCDRWVTVLLTEHQHNAYGIAQTVRRIPRPCCPRAFDVTSAGRVTLLHRHRWHPHSSPQPRLAISFYSPPVSGSDWALCFSRKGLASLCLNCNESVLLKFMENILIPPSCFSLCSRSAVSEGNPEFWLKGSVWMSCILIFSISSFPIQ